MFVILRVSAGSKERGITAGIVVGAVVGSGGTFRRANLRGIHEPCPLTWSCAGERSHVVTVDLRGWAGARCSRSRPGILPFP